MCLLLGLSSLFGQNSNTSFKNCLLYSYAVGKLTKNYCIWLLWCNVCPTIFEIKTNFQNGPQIRENWTNVNIILLFLGKPLDKYGITLVHITYPPWISPTGEGWKIVLLEWENGEREKEKIMWRNRYNPFLPFLTMLAGQFRTCIRACCTLHMSLYTW